MSLNIVENWAQRLKSKLKLCKKINSTAKERSAGGTDTRMSTNGTVERYVLRCIKMISDRGKMSFR